MEVKGELQITSMQKIINWKKRKDRKNGANGVNVKVINITL